MIQNSPNPNWNDLNEQTGYVNVWRRWFSFSRTLKILLASVMGSSVVIGSGIAFSALVANIFDFDKMHRISIDPNDFIDNLNDLNLIVDMSQVPIKVSDDSLRLHYLENTLERNFLQFSEKYWWGHFFLGQNNSNIIFQWFNHDNQNNLTVNDINHDGLFSARLKISLKINPAWGVLFDMGGFIVNTGKFIENFMQFNRFESATAHLPGILQNELGNRGYLGPNFNLGRFGSTINNAAVYQIINQKLQQFITNEQQEFGTNFHIFPLLTSLTLPDFNFFDLQQSATSYLPLLTNFQNNVFDFSNLNRLQVNQPFHIIYVPELHSLFRFLLAWQNHTYGSLLDFLKNEANVISFLPFVKTSIGLDSNQNLVHYSAVRFVKSETDWSTITNYFYQATVFDQNIRFNVNSEILKLSKNQYHTVDEWSRYICLRILLPLQFIYISSGENLRINFPIAGQYNQNFEHWKGKLTDYFNQRLSIQTSLYKINFYGASNQLLNLQFYETLPYDEVKHVEFVIGDTTNTKLNIDIPLSFFIKVQWND